MSLLFLMVVSVVVMTAMVAAGVLFWARGQVNRSQSVDQRQRLINLATMAAADETGRTLVQLLAALDETGPGGPVSVQWFKHEPAKSEKPGFLLKITWDGNEWRRLMDPVELRGRLAPLVAGLPDAQGVSARRLLRDLEAAAV